MKKIIEIIIELCKLGSLKTITSKHSNISLNLCCSIQKRNNMFLNMFSFDLPNEIIEWWTAIESAELFKDVNYGQWGLKILSEEDAFLLTNECLFERPNDFKQTDIVLGSFIGDSDLLVISCDQKYYGNVLVALPLDKRMDWYFVGSTFQDFLDRYIKNQGEKFWEYSSKI